MIHLTCCIDADKVTFLHRPSGEAHLTVTGIASTLLPNYIMKNKTPYSYNY